MAFASLFTLLDDIASVLDDVSLMAKAAAKKNRRRGGRRPRAQRRTSNRRGRRTRAARGVESGQKARLKTS